MTRKQFIYKLALSLGNLPQAELEKTLADYNRLIDERMRDGLTEEQAVARMMEPIEQIAARMLQKDGMAQTAQASQASQAAQAAQPSQEANARQGDAGEKKNPWQDKRWQDKQWHCDPRPQKRERRHSGWFAVLILCAFPVWFPLLMSCMGVGIALVCTVVALVIALVAGAFALVVGGGWAVVTGILSFFTHGLGSLSQIGLGLIALGVGILAGYIIKNKLPGIIRRLKDKIHEYSVRARMRKAST